MDPLRVLTASQCFFTRAQAREMGYGDRDVARALRLQVWRRIRRGYYVFADEWGQLDEVGRHRVMARAVAHSLGGNVALSHGSGLVMRDTEMWGVDLSRIHATRLDGGAGRIEGDVVHHEGRCVAGDVVTVDGVKVLAVDRCGIEAASRASNEVALVLLDGVLRHPDVDHAQLMARFEDMVHWPFTQHLHIVVRMADGRAATVGESRGRWLFCCSGLPAPELQFEVYTDAGELIGITDWAWPKHGLLGEFDGRIKYGRLLKPGQDPGEVVFSEKVREDKLREATGMAMVRLIWTDYDTAIATGQRLRRHLKLPA